MNAGKDHDPTPLARCVAALALAASPPARWRPPAPTQRSPRRSRSTGARMIGGAATPAKRPPGTCARSKPSKATLARAPRCSPSPPPSPTASRICRPFGFPKLAMENSCANTARSPSSAGPRSRSPSSLNQPDYKLSTHHQRLLRRLHPQNSPKTPHEWGHPFFLRFDWEMNGFWFPWSEGVNGNKRRRIRRRLAPRPRHLHLSRRHQRDLGLVPQRRLHQRNLTPLEQLYPGDAYVDWTCLDGFNWGKTAQLGRLADLQPGLQLHLQADRSRSPRTSRW